MDERFTPRPLAPWFFVGATASLLFMLLGCAALVMHLTTDPATLPLDQRVLFEAEPRWLIVAGGVTFVTGLVGSLLLLLRRRLAQPALLISLAAAAIWVAGLLATPSFRDLLSADRIAILLVTLALVWTIYWFARHSRQRGWLE